MQKLKKKTYSGLCNYVDVDVNVDVDVDVDESGEPLIDEEAYFHNDNFK